jgi:hypothetical protein
MLYNIVTEQVSQQMVFHELLLNSSIHMASVILYVRYSFLLMVRVSMTQMADWLGRLEWLYLLRSAKLCAVYNRVISIFLHLAYARCAPGVRRVCARLGADDYLCFCPPSNAKNLCAVVAL